MYRFGETVDGEDVGTALIESICDEAVSILRVYRNYPIEKIVDVLDACGQAWRGKDDYVPEMLKRENLKRRLCAELGDPYLLDGWGVRDACPEKIRCLPRGLLLHICAGNVSLGAIDSIVMGLLTKNVNIVKLSRHDAAFPFAFVESLKAVDKEGVVSRALAMLSWRGGEKNTESLLKKRCDTIVVWGGEAAVKSYADGASLSTKVLGFGPKAGIALVTRSALGKVCAADIASRLAHDITLWNQAACASPQVLYVEAKHDSDELGVLLKALKNALDDKERRQPLGRLPDDEEAERIFAYEKARTYELLDEYRVMSDDDRRWIVAVKKTPGIIFSPLNRFLYIRPVESIDSFLSEIGEVRPYLQTVGLESVPGERDALVEMIASAGASRIARIGQMLAGVVGAPHDGLYPMSELVRWVSLEERGGGKRDSLVRFAREYSPFYEKRSAVAFEEIPCLTGDDFFQHTPPNNLDLLTGGLERGYLFSSGGSTGRPKYSFYTYDEFRHVASMLADALFRAGLRPSDRVANLFVAGHLWSSFLAADKALETIGVVCYPIGGSTPIDEIIGYVNTFDVNAIIGIPSVITEVALRRPKASIEKIFYAGEHATAEAKELWRQAFGCKLVRSAGYASVDAGVIGYQCEFVEGSVHHLVSRGQYFELMDLESGKTAMPGDVGEIVVTALERFHMPLIRYRTGDLGRVLSDTRPCPCGSRDIRFELLGRCDDRIQIGGARVFTHDVSRALRHFSGRLNFNFQVTLTKTDARETLTLRVETVPGKTDDVNIGAIREAVYRECRDLRLSVDAGWLGDIGVVVVPNGAIERHPRTQKIKRVVDLR